MGSAEPLRDPKLRRFLGGVACRRLPAPELGDVFAVAAHDEVGEKSGPARLMCCSKSLPGVGVEVFVE
jgi:hypothetical protein